MTEIRFETDDLGVTAFDGTAKFYLSPSGGGEWITAYGHDVVGAAQQRRLDLAWHNVPTDEEAPGTRVTGEPAQLQREDIVSALRQWMISTDLAATEGEWVHQGMGALTGWLTNQHPKVAAEFVAFCERATQPR